MSLCADKFSKEWLVAWLMDSYIFWVNSNDNHTYFSLLFLLTDGRLLRPIENNSKQEKLRAYFQTLSMKGIIGQFSQFGPFLTFSGHKAIS